MNVVQRSSSDRLTLNSASPPATSHHPRQIQHVSQHRLPVVVLAPHREVKLLHQSVDLELDRVLPGRVLSRG